MYSNPFYRLIFAMFLGSGIATAQLPLNIRLTEDPRTFSLSVAGDAGTSQRIEASNGLSSWALFDANQGNATWNSSATLGAASPQQYFRMVQEVLPAIVTHRSWKNSVKFPDDPFRSAPIMQSGVGSRGPELRWIKFAIVLSDLPKVYFQDSNLYLFHYFFASERLSPFLGMSREEFDSVGLYLAGQKVILGAVVFAEQSNEFAVQFVGQDPYPREMVRYLYKLVDDRIDKPADEPQGFYIPTHEQVPLAQNETEWFAAQGIAVSSMGRWLPGDACYSDGWAIGRLVFVASSDIDAAYLRGDLLSTDILMTDGVPAEIPFVAGIVSTAPASPNSHVALLAQSYGVPFVYLANENQRTRAMALNGKQVIFRAGFERFTEEVDCPIVLEDASTFDPTFTSELLALKLPPELRFPPIEQYGNIVVPDLKDVTPSDVKFIGGKAANFGFLRREIPKASPDAMAITFDLWDEYLDQRLGEGDTLRATIAAKLSKHSWPTDIAALESDLSEIRDLVRKEADFSEARKQTIIEALGAKFDQERKIRFRSSTNVEDGESFIGAGLYDSFSGCLMDDTDGDDEGPSHCDSGKDEERGVFRAMRKVFASFYNLNAVVERLRRGVDESKVGMALLVHYSFPDEIEAANGVASSHYQNVFTKRLETTMVTQVGATSVTNPDGGSLPEVVDVFASRGNFNSIGLSLTQRSSLLLLGQDYVMDWQDDYRAFEGNFFKLAEAYAKYYEANDFVLDFEFKKLTSGDRIIKQIRQVPAVDGVGDRVAIVNAPRDLLIFQGETTGDVFAFHRLKSIWSLETDSRWLDEEGLTTSVFSDANLLHQRNGTVEQNEGAPSTWPGADHSVTDKGLVIDSWVADSDGGRTIYELRLYPPQIENKKSNPLFALADLDAGKYYFEPVDNSFGRPILAFAAKYETTLPANNTFDGLGTTREEQVALYSGRLDDSLPEGFRERTDVKKDGAVTVTSSYFLAGWPPIGAGYTSPLVKWDKTTITGLISQPITLRGYFSQTYKPGHHNFDAEYIFEPGLEEGLSAAILTELETMDIRLLYVPFGTNGGFKVMGFDGFMRNL